MNNVKIKTKGSQHASAMTEQDTSGQCPKSNVQCKTKGFQITSAGKTFLCDGKKYDLSHIPCNDSETPGPNVCIEVICNGRKVDMSQINPVSNGQTNGDSQTCRQVQSNIAVWYKNGVCHRCRGNQHFINNQVICDGTEVDQNGRPIDQNQNNPVWTGNDIRGQTFRGQDINQDQTNGFNSNTVRQGDHDHDHDHDLLGPGGKDYDNYDIKDWINWANTIKQLQLFEEKGGKPSAGGEKGGEP